MPVKDRKIVMDLEKRTAEATVEANRDRQQKAEDRRLRKAANKADQRRLDEVRKQCGLIR